MKPTVRVSIGGSAFNLEENAYKILDNYLKSLKSYFNNNPESEEIISDIEIRLSELLQMKMKTKDGVVSETDAKETIDIMGNPKDFDPDIEIETESRTSLIEQENKKQDYSDQNNSNTRYKKKLYRDEDNKIIGGVFSGLGHYFNIDPTILRVVVVTIILLFNFLSYGGAGTLILAYIILWMVMPAAKTFNQKLSMTGADPSIANIEDRSKSASLKPKSVASGCLGLLINCIAIFTIVITSIIMITSVGSLAWLYFDTEFVAFPNYLVLFGINSINFKIATILAIILPLIGIISLMLKIVRRSSFSTRTLVSFGIGLIFWFGSVFYIGNYGVKYAKNYRNKAESTSFLPIDSIKSDTIIIKLKENTDGLFIQPNNEAMLFKGEKMKNRQILILPTINIKTDSLTKEYKVEVRKTAFSDEGYKAERLAQNMDLRYTFSGDTLNLEPEWYNKNNVWDLRYYNIIIHVPLGKKAIIEKPLLEGYHFNYNFSINYNTIRRHDHNHRSFYHFNGIFN